MFPLTSKLLSTRTAIPHQQNVNIRQLPQTQNDGRPYILYLYAENSIQLRKQFPLKHGDRETLWPSKK